MSFNAQLADLFERMAKLLEVTGANAFRVNAYQRGARRLRELGEDLQPLADDAKKLIAIEGIGKGLAEKIAEFAESGRVDEFEQLQAEVPAGVVAMMNIPGVGPKTVASLWNQGGITSIDQLKQAIADGSLEDLPRMGKKTIEKIGKSIAYAESAGQRTRLGEALPMAIEIVGELAALSNVKRVDYAGSLRRGRETIGDIDILAACDDPKALTQHFTELDLVDDVILSGETKTSIRTTGGMQIDLRIVREDRYGAALMYFTGSKEHNVALRQRAIDRDLRLNEYGLWKAEDAENMDQAEPVVAETEQAIYKKLGLAYIEPELREDRGEIAAAEKNKLPKMIGRDDIVAELHAHTTASDGSLSIEELAAEARQRGFHTIAVTDHSAGQVQANGLDADRLKTHMARVRQVNEKMDDITLLAGAEVDIHADGTLDYEDDLLAELDIVVASPHSALSQESAKATERLIRAIENPYVHIIGHPTGRLIGRREGFSPDMAAVIEAAAQTGTALELNANPWRLDLRDVHLRAAVEAGCMIAINTDAHGPADFDLLGYGLLTARRGWVEPKHVVNCLSSKALTKWLQSKRLKMS